MPDRAKENPERETDAEHHARVQDLLTRSIQAHTAYRTAVRARDTSAAKAALEQADTLRQQAHDADPDHTAPVWQATRVTHPHDALLAFYTEQRAKT